MHSFQGQEVIIPNREVLQNPLINFSHNGTRRVDIDCGVAYGDDLEKVKRVVIDAVSKIENRQKEKDVEFFFKEFGGSSINFDVRFWIDFKGQKDFLAAQHEAIIKVKQAFDENDIMIPFPIRTLDFGIKGGEKLDAMLKSVKSVTDKNE